MKRDQICKALIYVSKMLNFYIEKMIERTKVVTTRSSLYKVLQHKTRTSKLSLYNNKSKQQFINNRVETCIRYTME